MPEPRITHAPPWPERRTMTGTALDAANARILALQRTLDRAREALNLGNVERAKRVLNGED